MTHASIESQIRVCAAAISTSGRLFVIATLQSRCCPGDLRKARCRHDPGLVPGHHDRTRDELDERQACRADAPSRPGDAASMADHEQTCPVGGSEQRPQRGVRHDGPFNRQARVSQSDLRKLGVEQRRGAGGEDRLVLVAAPAGAVALDDDVGPRVHRDEAAAQRGREVGGECQRGCACRRTVHADDNGPATWWWGLRCGPTDDAIGQAVRLSSVVATAPASMPDHAPSP